MSINEILYKAYLIQRLTEKPEKILDTPILTYDEFLKELNGDMYEH